MKEGLIALDAAPLIYYIEAHPLFGPKVRPLFDEIVRNQREAVASSLLIAETLTLPPEHRERKLAGYLDFFALPNLSLIPVDNAIARRAAELRMQHKLATPDAVHLATALAAKADVFITNDNKLKRVEGLRVITVDDL